MCVCDILTCGMPPSTIQLVEQCTKTQHAKAYAWVCARVCTRVQVCSICAHVFVRAWVGARMCMHCAHVLLRACAPARMCVCMRVRGPCMHVRACSDPHECARVCPCKFVCETLLALPKRFCHGGQAPHTAWTPTHPLCGVTDSPAMLPSLP